MKAVREILLHEWDPIGVADNPECFDEYDRYARTICRYIAEGIDAFGIAAYLSHVQIVDMGLHGADVVRNKTVASKLLSLSA